MYINLKFFRQICLVSRHKKELKLFTPPPTRISTHVSMNNDFPVSRFGCRPSSLDNFRSSKKLAFSSNKCYPKISRSNCFANHY